MAQSVFGSLFHEDTATRLDVVSPQNAEETMLATIEKMDVPRIMKIKNPPVPVTDGDGAQLLDEHGDLLFVDTKQYSMIRNSGWGTETEPRYFGTVGAGYEQVGAYEVSEMLDSLPGFKADSVRFCNGGETMLVQSNLDGFNLDKDVSNFFDMDKVQKQRESLNGLHGNDANFGVSNDVDINFFLTNPMGGSGVIRGGLMARIAVCANGAMLEQNIGQFSIRHTEGAADHLNEWLVHLYTKVTGQIPAFKQALQHLTTLPATNQDIRWIADTIYSVKDKMTLEQYGSQPRRIKWDKYDASVDWENDKNAQKADAIIRLYNGMGRGIADVNAPKTAWDIFMAVTEFENYKRTRNEYDTSAAKLFDSERGKNIDLAYNMLVNPEEYRETALVLA